MASSARRQFAARYSHRILLHLLHIDPDGAATGEPDLPGGLVGDAEFERLGRAALDHVERLGDDRALDTAARYRAEEIALAVDDEVRADRPRRRAPGLDHGGKRDAAALFAPFLGGLEDVVVARERLLHHHSPESHPGLTRGPSCKTGSLFPYRWIAGSSPAMTKSSATPPCPAMPWGRRSARRAPRGLRPAPPSNRDYGSAAAHRHAAASSGCPWPWPRSRRSATAG